MHTKTMEGLIGARTNMNLANTPMRVYREARRKGDSETMERAMRYAGECSDKAEEYKAEADEGMKKDAEESRRIAKEQGEEAIRKRRDEREKPEEKKALLKDGTDPDNTVSDEPKTDAAKEPVTYTKTGEAVSAEQDTGTNISVLV